MIYPEIRRASKHQELDRDQWADLNKLDYELTAEGNGEAYAGEFLFGRAFDLPPRFTFSSTSTLPQPITVGVADWIRDEQGMYVGANLWLKNDQPRGSGAVACDKVDPIVYGDNILRDPGFEQHSSYMPKGPNGEEFVGEHGFSTQQPGDPSWTEGYFTNYRPSRGWWDSDQIAWDNLYRSRDPRGQQALSLHPPATTLRYGDAPIPAWTVFSNNGIVPPYNGWPGNLSILPRWHISTVSPDIGSKYHARIIYECDGVQTFAGPGDTELFPISFEMCNFISDYEHTSHWFDEFKTKGMWSLRALPGDKITWSVRAKTNLAVDPADVGVYATMSMYAEIWNSNSFGGPSIWTESLYEGGMSTSYKTHTLTFTMPDDHEYVGLAAYPYVDRVTNDPNGLHFQVNTFIFDVDNAVLKVEPGPGNEGKARGYLPPLKTASSSGPDGGNPWYDLNLRFEGQILKSYAVVHPVEKQNAPTHITLK